MERNYLVKFQNTRYHADRNTPRNAILKDRVHRDTFHKTREYGKDVLNSKGFKESIEYIQHGNISVQKHSIFVAMTALLLAKRLHIRVEEKELVRGALLHDYFQYDWHNKKVTPKSIIQFYKMHGFTHPATALKNAEKDFDLTDRERDIIKKHMWPLTIKTPMYREAWLVTAADKYCGFVETFHIRK